MKCSDIDECMQDLDNCNESATCTDTDGSFTCMCDSGYMGDGIDCEGITILVSGGVCLKIHFYLDINECQNSSLNDCSRYAGCINLEGTFECDCLMGFTGNGTSCTSMLFNLL